MNSDKDLADTVDELATLKARLDLMGVSYHPSIKVEAARAKLAAAMADDGNSSHTPAAESSDKTEAQIQAELLAEASKLIRIRLTCMNPNKKEWPGEIITVGNSVVGTFRKFIPFHAEAGWHVPNIIYQYLLERECQTFYTHVDSRGNKTRKGKLMKEFAIELLPALTQDELQEMARQQAMAHAID